MKKTIAISLIASALLFASNSDVNSLTIDYTNNINNESSVEDSKVHQGKTNIKGSIVENVTLKKSTNGNTISGVDIEGSTVEQARFIITDANASSSTADGISIESDNTITNGIIKDGSTVRQTYTEIKGGSTVQGLTLKTINEIKELDSDASDINKSTVDQGILIVEGESTVVDFKQDATNTLEDTDAYDANLTQNSIIVKGGSTITSFKNGDTGGTSISNTMSNVSATNGAKVTQNTNTFDNAEINGLTSTQSNTITNVDVDQNVITQGNIEITGSEIKDFDVKFTNEIKNLTIIGEGSTEQGILIVTDSNATGSSDADVFEIEATNKLLDTDSVSGSSIVQSKTSIIGSEGGHSIVTDLKLKHTNTIESSTADGAIDNNLSKATISQAETIITNSTVNSLEQDFTNDVKQVEISDSSLSQGYTTITSSDVDDLKISQINTVDNSSIKEDSTVTQGKTNIEGD